jgi:hypothetical protein
MQGERLSIGAFAIFTGISLVLLMRGGPNDSYAGVVVFSIALMQLLEYGVWNNLDCNPGGSNNKASRIAYAVLWLMPAIFCLAAAFLATDVFADDGARQLLKGGGFIFAALACSLVPIMMSDKKTWCSQPGVNWVPNWYFLGNDSSPLALNPIWLIGVLIPTLLVDPAFLGVGSALILAGSYAFAKTQDRMLKGEWLSITGLLANSIGLWALLVPNLRGLLFGFPPVLHLSS